MTMSTQELFADCFKLLPAIFRDCVSQEGESHRFRLEYPQPVGEYVVATNGRILVRMRHTPEILGTLPEIPPGKFPTKSVGEYFLDRSLFEPEPTPIPWLADLPKCRECQGKGNLPKRRCHCDDYDSPCHDRGIIPAGPCWDCDGTGIENATGHYLPLRDDVRLAARYLHVLAKNRASVFLPNSRNTHDSSSPCYFTSGKGVDGFVMPRMVDKPAKAEETA